MRVLQRFKRALPGLALAGIATGVALVVLEVGVRLLMPQQLIQLRPDIWQPHDGLGWRHAPHLDVPINTGERTVRLRTDEQGFRIPVPDTSVPDMSVPDTSGTATGHRILALGDSFIEAIQVEAEDTVTERLADNLSATLGGPVEVVNTGVGGWGPNQYRLQARDELARRDYDAVVVFLFLGNDIVSWTIDHVDPRQPAQRRRLRLPRRLDKAELIDALAYPINNTFEERSHLFTLIKARLKFLLMRLGLSQHALPTSLRAGFRDGDHWRITASIVADIQDLATRHGLPTLAVLLPGVYQVEPGIAERYAEALGLPPSAIDADQPATLLGAALRDAGVDVLDATVALRAASAAGTSTLYGRVDTHLAPDGHRVVAEAVAPRLAARLTEQYATSPTP